MTTRGKRTLAVVVVVVVGLFVWILLPPSERPFFHYVAERRAAGLPTTLDELTGPMPPDAENGAADLKAAVERVLEEHGPSSSWTGSAFDVNLVIEDGQDGPTAEQVAPLTPIVAGMRPALERVEAALAKPHLRFPAFLGADGLRDGAHIRVFQNACRILSMPASAEDDPARRLAACRSLLVLSRRIEGAGIIDPMVARACCGSALMNLRHGVQRGNLDAAQAHAACDELLRAPAVDDYRRGLRAEPVGLIERYRAILDGRVVPVWSRPNVSFLARLSHRLDRLGARAKGESLELEFYEDLEPGEAAAVVKVCRAWEAAALADPKNDLESRAANGSATEIVLPRVFTMALRSDAQARLARVALAAAEHRAKNGHFPASLGELMWAFPDAVPLDPFTDAAFAYEKTSTGVRIASAGRLPVSPALDDASLREQGLVWELKR